MEEGRKRREGGSHREKERRKEKKTGGRKEAIEGKERRKKLGRKEKKTGREEGSNRGKERRENRKEGERNGRRNSPNVLHSLLPGVLLYPGPVLHFEDEDEGLLSSFPGSVPLNPWSGLEPGARDAQGRKEEGKEGRKEGGRLFTKEKKEEEAMPGRGMMEAAVVVAVLVALLLPPSASEEEEGEGEGEEVNTITAATALTVKMASASAASTEEMSEVFEPAKSAPSRSEAAAVQPVIGIGQRVKMRSGQKKDLGTLGYVLGLVMVVIIIAIGAGIVVGYVYKRGRDLKAERDQKAYEREMQRITLPFSAFTNQACDLVDENAVVVAHTNQTPVEDSHEGDAPLMGQAGTPGA